MGYRTPCEGVILSGKGISPYARHHSDVNCAKTAEPIEMPFALWTRVGPRKHVLDGPRSPWEGAVIRERACPVMTDDTLRERRKNG